MVDVMRPSVVARHSGLRERRRLHTRRSPTRHVAAGVVLLLLIAAGCQDKTKDHMAGTSGTLMLPINNVPGASATTLTVDVTHDPTTVNQVTFTDNTVMIDVSTFKQALRGAAADGQVLVFAPTPEIQKLQAGSVLLVKGVALRKVLAVMPFEGNIALLLTDAAITDAVRNGHIHVESHVGYDASAMLPPAAVPDRPHVNVAGLGLGIEPLVELFHRYEQGGGQAATLVQKELSDLEGKLSTQSDSANGGLSKCGKTSGNWHYCVGGSRAGSRIYLNVTVTKSDHGFIGQVQGNGYLDNFQMATDLDVDDSKLSSFRWDTKNANGLMNFQLTAAKENKEPLSKEDFEDAIPLPGSFELTYLVGPIPIRSRSTRC